MAKKEHKRVELSINDIRNFVRFVNEHLEPVNITTFPYRKQLTLRHLVDLGALSIQDNSIYYDSTNCLPVFLCFLNPGLCLECVGTFECDNCNGYGCKLCDHTGICSECEGKHSE